MKANMQQLVRGCDYGDVIRWTAAGRFQYAAIYVETGGWFTTAREGGPVAQVLNPEALARLLAKGEVSDVKLATRWLEVA